MTVTIGLTQIMRPVCLPSEANNSMLSQVLAWIENVVTEEMLTSLEAVNSNPDSTIKADILTH